MAGVAGWLWIILQGIFVVLQYFYFVSLLLLCGLVLRGIMLLYMFLYKKSIQIKYV